MMKVKGRLQKWIIGYLILCLSIGLFNSLICNEKPLVFKTEGQTSFPAFKDFAKDLGFTPDRGIDGNFDQNNANIYITAPIGYSHDFIDRSFGKLLPPLSKGINGTHYLGTDELGRDVLAGMIRGFYIAFKVGLITLFFSLIIGLFLGITMGYFGDYSIRLNALQIGFVIIGCFLWFFYIIFPAATESSFSKYVFPFLLLGISIIVSKFVGKLKLSKFRIPYDFIVFRTMEIMKAVPILVILLAVLPIFTTRGVSNIILILVFIGWRTFARYSRSEVLSIKEEAYINSAKSQGMGDWSIMFKEILPNILPTIYVLSSFAFASIIVLESTLSFLGIGLPLDEVSWGSLLAQGRTNIQAWWLSVFPGLAIFSIIIALNSIMDKKLLLDE